MAAAPRDVLLKHSADGIQEYDNPLPAWWLGIFYLSIVFTIVFIPYLQVTGWSQEGQYEQEIASAEARYAPAREARATAEAAAMAKAAEGGAPSAEDIEAGRAIFASTCIACHGADAHGGIGPNLTDAEWLHGGTLPEITRTVTEGVPAKGMLAWGPILGGTKIHQVASYVHSLGGGQ